MKKYSLSGLFSLFATLMFTPKAWAQVGTEDIAQNIVTSAADLPALISAFMYLVGIILVITGLLKLKEHVDNERQTPLRVPVIRLIVAGMCFALPLIYQILMNTFNVGDTSSYNHIGGTLASVSTGIGALAAFVSLGSNFNAILGNIIVFSSDVPGIVGALSYLLGLVIASAGILKLKEHVEEPEKVSLKEPITRFLTAGALFALPMIFKVIYTTIAGSGAGLFGGVIVAWNLAGFLVSSYEAGFANGCVSAALGVGTTLADIICYAMVNSFGMISFLTALAYVLGLMFGLWGVLKIRDHAINPTQTKLSEGVMRLLAGGAFFALPYVSVAIQSTFLPAPLMVTSVDGTTGYGAADLLMVCGIANSLDQAFGCFAKNLLGPTQTVLNVFCFIAGLIFIMIGISRLIKSAQDGPRGPGGLGTVTTFVTGGILLSGTQILAALSTTIFGSGETATNGVLAFTAGMGPAEILAAKNVVNGVIRFMIIVGLISFVRGIFILRDSAEGKGQASVMSGMTHIIGGALAVNLGPLINAVQATLGIVGFGVVFI